MTKAKNDFGGPLDGEPAVKQPHITLDYLVSPEGYGQEWVCCPACCSKPDGWWADGRPKYTGGTIEVRLPNPRGSVPLECVAACRCEAGQIAHNRPRGALRFFDELPPQTEFVRRAPAILWKRGHSAGPVPKPIHPEEIDVSEYLAKAAGILSRKFTGVIGAAQAKDEADALAVATLGQPHALMSWSLVLTDPRIKELYGSRWPDWKASNFSSGSTGTPALQSTDHSQKGDR